MTAPQQPASVRRVLHVTEAGGAGVASAIVEYIEATPYIEHTVIYTLRGNTDNGQLGRLPNAQVRHAGRGIAHLARAVLRSKNEHYDLIHLHSAWAGLIGRIAWSSSRTPIVYSPHSFYFNRTDVSPPVRWAARQIEWILGHNTSMVAALTPHEVEQARSVNSDAVWVPNAVALPARGGSRRGEPTVKGTERGTARPRVVMVGRLGAQKDPTFFASVCNEIASRGRDIEPIWLGDGDPQDRSALEALGVSVTGWMPRNDMLHQLARANVYVHTAAWEGSPMTLLEAHALEVPVVVRSIDSLVSLGYPSGRVTPVALAASAISVLDGGPSDEPTPVNSGAMSAALTTCYELAASVRRNKRDHQPNLVAARLRLPR